MPLPEGTRLGPYEIGAPLGAGGMGEVYRARDTRLDRTVAIKVLPAHRSSNPEMRQRLEREARAISSLNHPHICVLHDIGHQDGMDFLVMEYLEGETLAARVLKGPLPLDELLRFGIEIADALDKAHRQGLVHRDLKPGNIMLTKSGSKLLDFGLAKATGLGGVGNLSSAPTASSPSLGPAPSQPLTADGRIVGTYQYMSPEHLEGKEADARSDIFAFGAVLYEMATGRKAFEGKSQATLIAAIMDREPPPISQIAPMAPPALDRVVKTCLAKDPDKRWQTAHDVKLQLEWIAEAGSQAGVPAPVVARRKIREHVAWGVAAMGMVASLLLGIAYHRAASSEVRVLRSFILPPEKATLEFVGVSGGPMALSPDGRRMAFRAREASGKSMLWVRPLDALTAQPLAGTEGATFPFWSPDSRYVGFFADGKLKKIDVSGGPPQALADASDARGGTWNRDGMIVFAPAPYSPLYRVSAGGGKPEPVTKLDPSRRETTHRWPFFLPDGRHVLYFARVSAPFALAEGNGIYVASLDSGESKLVLRCESSGIYAPPGYLLFWREGSLMAQPYDAGRLQMTGDAFPVAQGVQFVNGLNYALFSVSQNGILAYQSGSDVVTRLVWFDANGKQTDSIPTTGTHLTPRLSPDGRQLVESLVESQSSNADLWLHDLARGVRTRFTFDPSTDWFPVWSPDGRRILFSSYRKATYDLFIKDASGAANEELLLESDREKRPSDWSPDGRFIAYGDNDATGKTKWDIWILPLSGDKKPFPFLQTQFTEGAARFSPDGRWLAYQSDESGGYEVYVAPFPGPGGKWMVSSGEGRLPVWRGDGKALFYLSGDNKLMSVDISAKGASVQIGIPRPLFQTQPSSPIVFGSVFNVVPNAQRFLVFTAGEAAAAPVTLVVNWPATLKK